MNPKDIKTLTNFAAQQSESDAPTTIPRVLDALEAFGRERLSKHFFMRDFLYSEISAVHGIPNVPCDPVLALKAGKGLCEHLLEPLHRTFGQVVIRSGFRSRVVNAYGAEHGFNCGSNKRNRAKHIWDWRDKDGCMGATACIVIPWFIDTKQYQDTRDWRPLAWYIHDHLPCYSEMVFYKSNAAFNLTWREREPRRKFSSKVPPWKGDANHSEDHSAQYAGFPKLKN